MFIVKAVKIKLTDGAIEGFKCEEGKEQSFLWCSDVPGLGVRAIFSGNKSYVFQTKVKGKSMRMTIGDVKVWNIVHAESEARRLQLLIDCGHDPRKEKARKVEIFADVPEAIDISARIIDRIYPILQRIILEELNNERINGTNPIRQLDAENP